MAVTIFVMKTRKKQLKYLLTAEDVQIKTYKQNNLLKSFLMQLAIFFNHIFQTFTINLIWI